MPQSIRSEFSTDPYLVGARDRDFRLEGEASSFGAQQERAPLLVPPRWRRLEDVTRPAEAAPGVAPLSELWHGLIAGKYQIIGEHTTKADCALALRTRPIFTRQATDSDVSLLEELFRGACLKAVAFNLKCAPSTVSATAQKWLRRFGLDCLFGRAPLLLAVAGCSSRRLQSPILGKVSTSESDGSVLTVVGVRRPDAALEQRLSPAEYAVARLILEGRSHREIATARGTSPRTIANQIGSIFKKLRVSGRFELLALALRSFYGQEPHARAAH